MKEQMILSNRIQNLCKEQNITYYILSYKSAVPMTTLMHIVNCSTKNPGFFTIMKICSGLDMTMIDFLNDKEFVNIEYEPE